MRRSSNGGFTLVELMITIAVAAIVLSIAVPSFRNFVANARVTSNTNQLVGDLHFARSEAMKRRQNIILCRSANPSATTPSCGGTAKTWTTGWLMFIDGDSNGAYDSGETLLRVGSSADSGIAIKSNTTADTSASAGRISYRGDGRLAITIGETAKFAVCDDRDGDGSLDASYGREISISAIGTVSTVSGSDTTISCNPT